jgi:putative membrane protein insertion efficiency factor
MGCCDSSAHHGGNGGICAAEHGTAQVAPARLGARVRHSLGAWVLLVFVRLYVVFLSPILGGACKFYPSCSNYAYEAVARHGARKGAWLAAKRLLRCRPFTQGGFDPVPEVLYEKDALQEPKSVIGEGQLTPQTTAHRPTQPVVTETWSAAGTLGVERRL